MFGKLFQPFRVLKIDCWASRHLLCEENLNYLGCVPARILVEKWNIYIYIYIYIYNAHIFPLSLAQTCWLETTSLCIYSRLRVNKNFQILIIFIKINVTLLLLCAHPLMTSIIIHTRRPNTKKHQLSTWFLNFSWCSFYAFCGAENNVLLCSISLHE